MELQFISNSITSQSGSNKKIILLGILGVVLVIVLFFAGSLLPQKRNQLPYNKTYEFKGAKLSFKEIGDGNPIILLHGSLLSNPWGGWEEKLAKNYKVYLPDLPGYGASDAVGGELHSTDLFAHSLCEFINKNNLRDAPIISFSLGTIVALKSAESGCTTGKLILIGVPGKVNGSQVEIASKIPLFLRRYLASTQFGKENFLVPIVYGNVGERGARSKAKTVELLSQNDPRAHSDINPKKEIEEDLPKILPKIENEMVFVYGDKDLLKTTTKSLIDDYEEITGSRHNIFVYQPEKSLAVVQNILAD